jgi:AcrR family transcriptional regulator
MTRSDALRNRERVIEAAAVVFAERGMDAGVDEVAMRAGVGKATVYRSFETKEHLYAAVAVQRARWFEERAEAAAERPDAFAALEELLVATAEMQAGDRVVGSSLYGRAAEVPDLAEGRRRARAALERLVSKARDAGGVRADVTAEDVGTLFSGFSRVLSERDERDPAVWRRYARLVVAAVRS